MSAEQKILGPIEAAHAKALSELADAADDWENTEPEEIIKEFLAALGYEDVVDAWNKSRVWLNE